MPILTGVPLAPSRPVLTPQPQTNRQAATWSWEAPDGERLLLTGRSGVFVEPGGIVGHLMPPVALHESDNPGIDGGFIRGQKWKPRPLGVKLTVAADTATEWRNLQETLPRVFDTSTGEGTLVCTQPDGAERRIACVYESGLEGIDPGALFYAQYPLLLKAPDPWWRGGSYEATLRGATQVPWFPYFPLVLNDDGFDGGFILPRLGHRPSWPVWTITGPTTRVTLSLNATGELFTMTGTLDAGEQVVIRTDPREPSWRRITTGTGENAWGVVAGDYPTLFGLPHTGGTVTVEVDGATVDTAIQVWTEPRFRTA